jgi:hypothetical protein
MSRIYRTQKERERFLVCEFVNHLGYRISSPKWQERPDALLTLSDAGQKKRTAIEITDHYNDTIAGRGSPRTPIGEFWNLVESSLMRRISHRKNLTGILGNVRFASNVALPSRTKGATSAKSLAAEIVKFADGHPLKKGRFHTFTRNDFAGYPVLRSLLSAVRLARFTEDIMPASRCSWSCSNITTGPITVSLAYLESAIATKNKKALTYENWDKAEQKWLLIVAGGGNVSTHAPRQDTGINWRDSTLIQLGKSSPFDRIAFWERIGRWHRWIK